MAFVLHESAFMQSAVGPGGYPEPGPPEFAFAGRSNVGKSSLINCLLRRKNLVKVSQRPGRTQQINFFALNDDALRFVDLPGYGFAKVPLAIKAGWKKMIESYLESRPTLKAVVVIVDIRREPSPDDLMLLGWLLSLGLPAVVAVTKADKLSRNQAAQRLAKLRPQLAPYDAAPVVCSAVTGQGRQELWERLLARLAD